MRCPVLWPLPCLPCPEVPQLLGPGLPEATGDMVLGGSQLGVSADHALWGTRSLARSGLCPVPTAALVTRSWEGALCLLPGSGRLPAPRCPSLQNRPPGPRVLLFGETQAAGPWGLGYPTLRAVGRDPGLQHTPGCSREQASSPACAQLTHAPPRASASAVPALVRTHEEAQDPPGTWHYF